ncbi:zinc-ribbon domain-containing protein [Anaerovibrio lipolyticus DSM 3074]|uniref:Zinc-ribbon domain-containing protein n=2 Tax=Anaerovibrio lipolyticus TaxID=82374 RepID=A0A0B2JYN8_9FIRM|nr:zinc ribbon domain-containing protein [Anaerovibrio lipolyticus]KHM51838.1 hypothetical protein NZ47_08290 [Anaerovibrio lipolyticus]SHI93837.1 zinc-ribbon domain-containing protein [Anaerovibrio lipolyticus DSM 3074]
MFCPKCGANLPDGTKFCSNCGANVDTPVPNAPQSVPSNNQPISNTYQQNTNSPNGWNNEPNKQEDLKFWQKSWFMWVCLIFLTPIGIILCYVNRERHSKWKVICGVFAVLFLIGVFMPKDNHSKQATSTNVTQEQEVNKKTDVNSAEKKAAEGKKQTAADYKILYNQVMGALQPADDAMQARKDVAAAGDFVGMINKMAAEKDAIATAKNNLSAISAPASFDSDDRDKLQKGKESIGKALDQRDAFIMYMARYIQNQSQTDFEMAQQSIKLSDAAMMAGLACIVSIGQKYNAN